ncbi:GtrA family protein [Tersicoccus sp. Bi-70]|uniref:GtrA family protein n=1 Tax=Tersicoccus sp. Bi-70 TaxID=1897634 RepID=UPI0009785527|nr:GtrA family protein [Tersicoccus sp. Bi-70]OMH31405.1 polysaccharide synthesis protein GtrA [Tersicoccus sp. Bi-70]
MQALMERFRGLFSMFVREVLKFGTVGAVGVVINNGVWFLLVHGPMADSHAKAKVVSGIVATLFAWVANRYWTFRHKRQPNKVRELVQFLVINAIGVGIEAGCVWFTSYVLGLRDTTSSFIAGGVVGLALGTVFRFIAYRYWVFSAELNTEPEFADDIAAQDQHRWTETERLRQIRADEVHRDEVRQGMEHEGR